MSAPHFLNLPDVALLAWLPFPLLGILTLSLLVLNTLLWGVPLHLLAAIKLVVRGRLRRHVNQGLREVAMIWAKGNDRIMDLTQRIYWDVEGDQDLGDLERSCLLTANHQSWADILALMRVINRRLPFPRFFAKRELLWVPVIGVALWALEFPLVRRVGREALEQHPELRRHDMESTRRACQRYRAEPVTLISFLEGTRFRPHKHSAQRSPFRHLLRPKSGGVGFALEVMGQQLARHVDVTIAYPEGRTGFFDMLSGRIGHVVVRVHQGELPPALQEGSGLAGEEAFRAQLRAWAWELWQTKDQEIDALLEASTQTELASRRPPRAGT